MALPAIIGLSSLATFFSSWFVGVITFFLSNLGKRILLVTAFFTAFSLLFISFNLAITSITSSFQITIPQSVSIASTWLIPSNIDIYMNSVLSLGTIKLLFRLKSKLLEIKASV